jgi:hypothetical protein
MNKQLESGITISDGGYLIVKNARLFHTHLAARDNSEIGKDRYNCCAEITLEQYKDLVAIFTKAYKDKLNITATKKIIEGKNFPIYNDGDSMGEDAQAKFEGNSENAGKEFKNPWGQYYIKPYTGYDYTAVDMYGKELNITEVNWWDANVNLMLKPGIYKSTNSGYSLYLVKIQVIEEGQGQGSTAPDIDFGYETKSNDEETPF